MKYRPPTSNGHGSEALLRVKDCLETLTSQQLVYLDLIRRDTLLEKIVHLVLEGKGQWDDASPTFSKLVQEIVHYATDGIKTVVFGGGAGLSSILSSVDLSCKVLDDTPAAGLAHMFPDLAVVVCTTDDGGSSGKILRSVPCIAVGDIRRAVLACTSARHLVQQYALSPDPIAMEIVIRFLHAVVNHRFKEPSEYRFLWNPIDLVPKDQRDFIPRELIEYLSGLGRFCRTHPVLAGLDLKDQCLGNLWITAAIYRCMEKNRATKTSRGGTPGHRHILEGIDEFAAHLGAGHGRIFPASTSQGELRFLYSHGVVSCGEHKSSLRHSSFPVQHVWVTFIQRPHTPPALLRKIQQADLIILAPGSLYSSIIPIFQVTDITEAVRSNRQALKILGANFWAQRGETDISTRRFGKEYYVSELIEAYHSNIPGGIEGLVHKVVVTDLQSIPGDILRNYALEGKVPIYLDKQRVLEWGLEPVEAAVFSEDRLKNEKVIQHDAAKFSLVIKTLVVLQQLMPETARIRIASQGITPPPLTVQVCQQRGFLCDYAARTSQKIDAMDIPSQELRSLLKAILWENREILPEHLSFFRGLKVISAGSWARSTEWDKILGYYDPEDEYIKIHESLLHGPQLRLVEDILIAMGESLLGNYVLWKRVKPLEQEGTYIGKVFELYLRTTRQRRCFLTDKDLAHYLTLAQLSNSSQDKHLFSMLINDNEAFTPPGLLFGLLYAWYLNNHLGGVIDYEMSLLKWNISELIPKQSMERTRRQNLIEFFRSRVFRQHIPR